MLFCTPLRAKPTFLIHELRVKADWSPGGFGNRLAASMPPSEAYCFGTARSVVTNFSFTCKSTMCWMKSFPGFSLHRCFRHRIRPPTTGLPTGRERVPFVSSCCQARTGGNCTLVVRFSGTIELDQTNERRVQLNKHVYGCLLRALMTTERSAVARPQLDTWLFRQPQMNFFGILPKGPRPVVFGKFLVRCMVKGHFREYFAFVTIVSCFIVEGVFSV